MIVRQHHETGAWGVCFFLPFHFFSSISGDRSVVTIQIHRWPADWRMGIVTHWFEALIFLSGARFGLCLDSRHRKDFRRGDRDGVE